MYRGALETDPDLALAHAGLGLALDADASSAAEIAMAAGAHFRRAAALEPNSPAPLMELSNLPADGESRRRGAATRPSPRTARPCASTPASPGAQRHRHRAA